VAARRLYEARGYEVHHRYAYMVEDDALRAGTEAAGPGWPDRADRAR
jgi:hypothetical protein